MKDKIKEALKEIVPDVYYGAGRFQGRENWDCIVFGKRRAGKSESKGGITRRYFVAIVKEEYIPEDLEKQVIEKMKTLGFKIRLCAESRRVYCRNLHDGIWKNGKKV